MGLYSGLAYDATNLLIKAIQNAGARSRADVLKAVQNIGDFQGITGTISFDERGDNKNSVISVYRVTDGKLEFIETVS